MVKPFILPLKGNQSPYIILTDLLIANYSMLMVVIVIFYLISITIMPKIIIICTSKTWGCCYGESSSSFKMSSNSFYSSL